MTAYIELSNGMKTLVDDDMFEFLNQWKWQYSGRRYVTRHEGPRNKQKMIWMHRIVANTPDGMETDHINHNTLDNRRSNLRICTKSQNQGNRKSNSNNTSGFRGVSWHKSNRKYSAAICVFDRQVYLGEFDDPEDAARAYDRAAKEAFGEFAVLNFPE